MKGTTQGKGQLPAQNVAEHSRVVAISKHTKGFTLERNHMPVPNVNSECISEIVSVLEKKYSVNSENSQCVCKV